MILPIVQLPGPVLRKTAKPVLKIDKKILRLVADMTETLKSLDNPKGVGLAAPQVGESLKLFIVDMDGVIKAFINPEILQVSKNKVLDKENKEEHFFEGCLSLKKIYGFVNRHRWLKLKYQDEEGITHKEKYTGKIAEYIQHEIDHLNGVIFIDRSISQGFQLYKVEKNKKGEEIFHEIENI